MTRYLPRLCPRGEAVEGLRERSSMPQLVSVAGVIVKFMMHVIRGVFHEESGEKALMR